MRASIYDVCDRCGHRYLPKMIGKQVLNTPCPRCATRVTPPESSAR